MPKNEAIVPQTMLPTAMLACTATRLMPTARARTQAGAVDCVPADRLANTPTHAIPVPNAPKSANGLWWATASSTVETTQSAIDETTSACSDCFCSRRGIAIAPTTAPKPKVADSRPKPLASVLSRSRAISGSSAQNALAQSAKVRLWRMNARIAGEWRAKRRPLCTPEASRSGTPGSASDLRAPRSMNSVIGRKKAAESVRARPEPSQAAKIPASAGPTARATLKATAPSATARESSLRPTSSLMLACCAGW